MEDIQQQTAEWHNFRRQKIGSSDACVIMQSVDWSTPYKLWLEKLGKAKKTFKGNYVTELGNAFEPAARALYELEHGFDFEPTIVVSEEYPFLMSSLDGLNKEIDEILEIKCVQSDVFEQAKKGIVASKYYPQVQEQLLVTRAKVCNFWVAKLERRKFSRNWHIAETALVKVYPDEEYQKKLLVHLVTFWGFVTKQVPPPLTDSDVLTVADHESVMLFERMKKARGTDEESDTREELIEYAERILKHKKIECSGVYMSKTKAGHWMIKFDGSDEVPKAG